MMNMVSAPGLALRPYFRRFTDDALDLCDCLSSFNPNGRVKLHELCRALGSPGKPDEMDGSMVDEFVRAGRIGEVSAYCECDVVNTYRLWLRYELFLGILSRHEFDASEDNLSSYLRERLVIKPRGLSANVRLVLNRRTLARSPSCCGQPTCGLPSYRTVPARRADRVRLPKGLRPTARSKASIRRCSVPA
jgi:hypothetical protein